MQIEPVLVLSFMMVARAIKPKFVSPNVMTFEEAETFCQQKCGRLAQPTSVQDTYFKAGETASKYYWFGAYLMPSGYFWTNGTAISWHNWNGGSDKFTFPPDKRGLAMESSTHKWFYANPVSNEYQALCEPIIGAYILDRLTRAEEKTQEMNEMMLRKFRDLELSIQLQLDRHVVSPISDYKRIASQAARGAYRNSTSQNM